MPSAPLASAQVRLRLLQTTDLHAHVLAYDYASDQPTDRVGLARTATLIAQARAEAKNCLLFDNGDFLQGTPLGDLFATQPVDPHPVIAAMNALGYDAGTLGNHEFNYGLPVLRQAIAGAAHPVVLANATAHETPLAPPYVILPRRVVDDAGQPHDLQIGVIGIVPPQILKWDHSHLHGHVEARDIVETARALVPRLRAEGADLVVALCHAGIGPADHMPGMEQAATALAGLPGIDAILAGHSHLRFPGPDHAEAPGVDPARGTLQEVPAVMAGCFGSHLGVIDLTLNIGPAGWRVVAHQSALRPILPDSGPVADAPQIVSVARDSHIATLAYTRRPVGRCPRPLTSYFAQVVPTAGVALVAQAQEWAVRQAVQGTPLAELPLLSAAAPFKAGGRGGPRYFTDIPAGDLAIRNLADLYLYPNALRAVRLTGAELILWLERAAGQFNQIEPGSHDTPLLEPLFAAYNFDLPFGLSFAIDLSQPARFDPVSGATIAPTASRIVKPSYNDQPLDLDQEFLVATNAYRGNGGGSFPGLGPDKTAFESPLSVQEVLVNYVREIGTVDPAPAPTGALPRCPAPLCFLTPGPARGAIGRTSPATRHRTLDPAPMALPASACI